MRLEIDWTRCEGHGLCAAVLPDRIGTDEWGYPVLHNVSVDVSVDATATTDVRRAIAVCPALALRMTEN